LVLLFISKSLVAHIQYTLFVYYCFRHTSTFITFAGARSSFPHRSSSVEGSPVQFTVISTLDNRPINAEILGATYLKENQSIVFLILTLNCHNLLILEQRFSSYFTFNVFGFVSAKFELVR
jgi:hypothetical protein